MSAVPARCSSRMRLFFDSLRVARFGCRSSTGGANRSGAVLVKNIYWMVNPPTAHRKATATHASAGVADFHLVRRLRFQIIDEGAGGLARQLFGTALQLLKALSLGVDAVRVGNGANRYELFGRHQIGHGL